MAITLRAAKAMIDKNIQAHKTATSRLTSQTLTATQIQAMSNVDLLSAARLRRDDLLLQELANRLEDRVTRGKVR